MSRGRQRRGPAWVRSVRRRPAAATAIMLLSAGAVLVSTVTPMLIGAVAAATLREGVAAARLPESGISVSSTSDPDSVALAQSASEQVLAAATGGSDLWGPAREVLESQYTPVVKANVNGYEVAPRFSIALDGCDGMRISGSCPGTAVEALLPRSLARTSGWGVGTVLLVPDGGLGTIRVDVVGLYDETAGRGRWLADPTVLSVTTVPRRVSNVVLGDGSLGVFPSPYTYVTSAVVDMPVQQSDVATLRGGVAAATEAALDPDAAQVAAAVQTGLPDLLSSIARQQAAGAQLATPIGLEAGILAWFALGAVAQRTARARAAEWGIGRMRGLRPRAWLAAVFVEPAIAVLVGAALGYPTAIFTARLVAAATLGTADGVAPIAPVVLTALGLAVAGSLAALTVATIGAARRPLQELLGDSAEPRRLSRLALVGQVSLVSIAVAVLVAALTTTDTTGPQLGLLLPVLLAMVVGLTAVRLAVVLVRRSSQRLPRSLISLIVGRGLARAPSALVAAQLVLVSVALGAYTLQVETTSVSLQTHRAQLAVGATQVLHVQVPPGVSLLKAVRRADPSGRTALAAAELDPGGTTGTARVVAVDTTRVDQVSNWRRQWQGGADLSRLRASEPDLVLVGTRLSMTISGLSAGGALGLPIDPGVRLEVVLETGGTWQVITVGILRNTTLRAVIPCSEGCRVVALRMIDGTTGDNSPWGARFVVTALSTDRQSPSSLMSWLSATRWRNRIVDATDTSRLATATATASTSGGLTVLAQDRLGALTAQLEPAVGPALIPAIVSMDTGLVPFPGVVGAITGTSLSQSDVLLHPVARAAALPRSLRSGVLLDLAEVQRATAPSASVAQPEVWLAPGPQHAVLHSLRQQGVRVVGREKAAAAVSAGLARSTNRSLLLSGATAFIGVLFGLLALVGARVIDMPERRREWRTLRMAGVTASARRRLALVQLAVPAAAAAVLGALAGSFTASITVSRLLLQVEQVPGPPLDATPPFAALMLLTTSVVLVIVLLSVVVSRIEVAEEAP